MPEVQTKSNHWAKCIGEQAQALNIFEDLQLYKRNTSKNLATKKKKKESSPLARIFFSDEEIFNMS